MMVDILFPSLLTLDMSTVQRNHPALMENNLLALVGESRLYNHKKDSCQQLRFFS